MKSPVVAWENPDEIMLKQTCEVQVLVNGSSLPEYHSNGKIFIEGKKGSTFSIKVRNNSWKKRLFIVTVDGLSVMNGEDGSYDSGGYIVQPYTTLKIDGWRTSNQEVAEFFFSSPDKSYGKRIGKGKNLGVIGVAVFDEVEQFIPNFNFYCDVGPVTSSNNFNSVRLSASSNVLRSAKAELGTGFGDSKRSEVVEVEFKRQDAPFEVCEIFYNTREQLQKEGVLFKEPVYVTPQSFPGKFCKPPKDN